MRMRPGWLSATMMAIAPAFWAFSALTPNSHVPRSTNAILPRTASALVKAVQPSAAGAAPSTAGMMSAARLRSEEHTSELQSRLHLVCRLLLEKKNNALIHDVFAIIMNL